MLTDDDLKQIRDLGISKAEFERQLQLFRSPPEPLTIDRPCRIDDGILQVDPQDLDALVTQWELASEAGRLLKFVPASGAASRMFKSVLEFPQTPSDPVNADVQRLFDNLSRLPFENLLAEQETPSSAYALQQILFGPKGLQLHNLPKGLIPFHKGPRTAFEEHLVEGAAYARSAAGKAHIHYTVQEEHRLGFEALLAFKKEELEKELATEFDVSFSYQDPSTNTLAVTLENEPFRDEHGRLVFRPGGHGALLQNLEATQGDVVVVKNIDNVVPDSKKEATLLWKKVLVGLLIHVQDQCFEVLRDLEGATNRPEACARGAKLLEERFLWKRSETDALLENPDGADRLHKALNRPLRICGVVRNQGEPGGGPFWVKDQRSPQIVESSQIDVRNPEQRVHLENATHFNPVDLVCGLRDVHGQAFSLDQFVDRNAVFIAEKSHGGKDLRALERPGLWNGAMAYWNTIFVEVPIETFAPVKTVFDLLRPEHQG